MLSRHINKVFNEKELDKKSNMHFLHTANSDKPTRIYSLDVVISVGYRVKSQQGTQFRIWANRVLKEYLIKGYAVKDTIKLRQYEELKQTIKVLSNVPDTRKLKYSEATGLPRVVTDYAYALDTLDKYDYQQLTIDHTTTAAKFEATDESATAAIEELRATFGNEKDQSFRGSLGAIYQTFQGDDLYPSVEEKAAMLLYLVTKIHSFSDGNKRIAAFLFLWFMEKNGILYNADGTKRIGDNALVALTLMIAESRTEGKDVMVKVVVNLIDHNN